MRLAPRAVAPAVMLILLAALTGCAHTGALDSVVSTSGGAGTSSAAAAYAAPPTSPLATRTSAPAAPAGTASSPVPDAHPLGGVAQNLNGVDDAIAQAGSDVVASDSAVSQIDAP